MSNDQRGNGKVFHCSFCGKSQHEVRKLIAGPSVYVCDECVSLCNDIINEESNTNTGRDVQMWALASRIPLPARIWSIMHQHCRQHDSDQVLYNRNQPSRCWHALEGTWNAPTRQLEKKDIGFEFITKRAWEHLKGSSNERKCARECSNGQSKRSKTFERLRNMCFRINSTRF